MTENDANFFKDPDEPEIYLPDDGSDTRPPEEGSSDYPDTLEDHDPLQEEQVVLKGESGGATTVAHREPAPASDETTPLEELQVVDQENLEEDESERRRPR